MNKNQVDWALYQIRLAFMRSVKRRFNHDSGISELLGDKIEARQGWPMIHVSREQGDVAFATAVISERGLAPDPVDKDYVHPSLHRQVEGGQMAVVRYEWGAVVMMTCTDAGDGDQHRTLVVEGDFNPRSGVVKGDNGAIEELPVAWYGKLLRRLLKGSN